MGKPTIGELDTDVDKAQTEIPKKLTVLEETSGRPYTILFFLILLIEIRSRIRSERTERNVYYNIKCE